MKPAAPKPPFLDPNPPKYTTPVPRMLPRDPRLPSDVNDLMRPDVEARDTVPAITESGEDEVSDKFDEETPPDGPFAVRTMIKELRYFRAGFEEMKTHCRASAENSFATSEAVRALNLEMQEMKKEHNARIVRLELADRWVPRLAWLVTTAIAVIALLRTFKT